MYDKLNQMDTKELELPETTYVRDIETRVFQALILQSLATIEGIGLIEGTLFDSLLGRDMERIKGIHVEQDQKKHSVSVRVEINVIPGISIPEKAEEIQTKIVEDISKFSGLHVSCVHVIFKNLIVSAPESEEKKEEIQEVLEVGANDAGEYSEF